MIVTTAELKEQLNISDDLGTDDDALIGRTIAAAQGLIERQLGFAIETTYPDVVPPPLQQAVCLLACHWYENREGTLIGVTGQEIPFGVRDIVAEYREYSFDG
ncbi:MULTISPECIES: head-tail connector protein [unclassified Rhizobium]|uniref:head-tail connector protein n=1 Tax=unclassified Rhizobium TaxID=2613769 RepID=UPI0025F4AAE0|nr:head-tail connector protein [Rhizobium sp. UBA1881]